MVIWLIVLTTLGAAAFFLFFVVRGDVRNEQVWKPLEEAKLASLLAGAAAHTFRAQAAEALVDKLCVEERSPHGDVRPQGTDGLMASLLDPALGTRELWINSDYCWVVVCKNHWFHHHPNTFNVHRIPLGPTDAVALRPPIKKPFAARCDECGKEYTYKPREVLRYEMSVPASFVPHPLFRE